VAHVQSAWWKALSIAERVIHANRNRIAECQHATDAMDWPEDLRLSYSHDPYFHTSHLDPCFKSTGVSCDCQMCLLQIGVERGTESRRVNPDKVRKTLNEKMSQL
jgi:hypothetical protein